jgi:hypothetical protein
MKLPSRSKTAKPLAAPPDSEIEAAINQLRSTGALCYVRLWSTNQGISGELSFNTAEAVTTTGTLEIRLKRARIDLGSTASTQHWSWNEELMDAANANISSVEETHGQAYAHSSLQGSTSEAKIEAEAKAGIPGFAATIAAKIGLSTKDEETLQNSANRQSKFTRPVHHIKAEHRGLSFRLEFEAFPLADLSYLNTHLTRLPLLDVPEPSALDLNNLQVQLRLSYDGEANEIQHAFAISKATGAWRQLQTSTNRRAIAEVLLSKFLPKLHEPLTLWPHETPLDGEAS